ncbi:type III-B CRISPR module-associated protein Cmr5 [Tengunoibacter tsumagoiensis]|uniref:CRISPR type III-B/RAMP module-associated protein Cmr5 n=1 Tax=Tengunoibacter tsumagoiensis TaxID=2014871 RepID=A0A402A5Z0_9CHLR|nr:type III-B CRISPR module-associated protein Cmr5 [Tengunoibacter tsumagoiensis]GCE14567.1 CRISPR system Cmr subunit Cmr5 [Tengunoibacter tsumagoiensis]
MQTLDQQYATNVLKKVELVRKDADYKKYGAISHSLPILIHNAGLAQALSFVDSRKEPIFKTFLKDLSQTVVGDETLLQKSRESDLISYMQLTHRVLNALLWYKRFAQSILEVEASEDLEVRDTPNEKQEQ